jgi:hypothetical protein
MVTGITGMHKCHYVLHFLSTATGDNWHAQVSLRVTLPVYSSSHITAHWHMDDVNHDNTQCATCVVCILWSFYHSWAPLFTVCLEHTGQCALLSLLMRNMLPHLGAMCISESKYNIFYLFFNKESLWRVSACLFTVCVCVCVCFFFLERGVWIPVRMF